MDHVHCFVLAPPTPLKLNAFPICLFAFGRGTAKALCFGPKRVLLWPWEVVEYVRYRLLSCIKTLQICKHKCILWNIRAKTKAFNDTGLDPSVKWQQVVIRCQSGASQGISFAALVEVIWNFVLRGHPVHTQQKAEPRDTELSYVGPVYASHS